jgi:hypothetical protein
MLESKKSVKAVDAHTFNKQEKKFKQISSATKSVTAVFWDKKRVLMVEFMQEETTIMSQVYCETLKAT